MSHKSGGVIINRAAESDSLDMVQSVTVELQFPANTSLEAKMKKIRQVECLLDKLEHDDDA